MQQKRPVAAKATAWAGALVLAGALIGMPAFAAGPAYSLSAKIPLPSSSKHGDVVAYDAAANMVYASNPAGGLAIIDLATNKLVTVVKLPYRVNGVDFNKQVIFVSDQGDNTFDVIQKGTWKVVASDVTTKVAATATTPDAVLYDAANDQVFVTIDDNNTVQVYSASAPYGLKKVIDLNAVVPNASIFNVGPDLTALAQGSGTLYESDGNWLLSYNTSTLANTGKLDTGLQLKDVAGKLVTHAGLKQPAYADGQVFVGGDGTRSTTLYVADSALLKVKTTIAVPAAPDALVADASNNMLYGFASGMAGDGGFFAIDAKTDKLVAQVSTGGHAHTGTVNPGNGDVYVLASGSTSAPNPALLVYAPQVSKATSPVTGVPRWPLVAGLALILVGGTAIWMNRRMLKDGN